MHEFWSHFTKYSILASGNILDPANDRFGCTARFTQIFNGRIEYELEIEEDSKRGISRWLERNNTYSFEGETEQGQSIRSENLKPAHFIPCRGMQAKQTCRAEFATLKISSSASAPAVHRKLSLP